jgi:hypothetical protein
MKRLLSSLALAVASLAAAPFASATVLTFDDLPDGGVPANYGGLDWSAGDWSAFSGEQAPFTAHSGDGRVTTGFDDVDALATIGLGAGKTFQGAWFSGFENVSVTFELYDHGSLVGTSSTLATSGTPTWLASGYGGLVDTVVVASGDQGSAWTLDDLTFAAAVPEPGSMTLMAGGLLALAVVARRRA